MDDWPVNATSKDYPDHLTKRQMAAINAADRAGVLDTVVGRPGYGDVLRRLELRRPLTPAEVRSVPAALDALEQSLQAQEQADAAERAARREAERAAAAARSAPPPPPTLQEQIQSQRECIAQWQRVIEREKRIARESGFVNKSLMYVAGSRVVECQDALKRLEAPAKKK